MTTMDADLREFLDHESALKEARKTEVWIEIQAEEALREAEEKAEAERKSAEAEAEAVRRQTVAREREERAEQNRALSTHLARVTARDSLAPAPIRIEIARLRKTEEAKRYLANEKARGIEIGAPVGLGAFLAQPDLDEQYVVEGLWPIDGNIAFGAQRKAGKTRLAHNLIRSLADGDDFLDAFAVPAPRRVANIDFELPEPMLRAWLRGQQIRKTENVVLVEALKGRAATFDIRDDATRARWAKKLRDVGTEVLILDPLRPILRALGLDEWREVGLFLDAFDALKVEAGIREGIIAHHHGHHAQRAAGDSSFEGWGDAIWNITRDDPTDPRAFRFFDAYGRGVDRDKGLVSLYDEHRLAFAPESVQNARRSRVVDDLLDWMTKRGTEAKKADILAAEIRGVNSKTFTTVISEAEQAGSISFRVGEQNAKFYTKSTAKTGGVGGAP